MSPCRERVMGVIFVEETRTRLAVHPLFCGKGDTRLGTKNLAEGNLATKQSARSYMASCGLRHNVNASNRTRDMYNLDSFCSAKASSIMLLRIAIPQGNVSSFRIHYCKEKDATFAQLTCHAALTRTPCERRDDVTSGRFVPSICFRRRFVHASEIRRGQMSAIIHAT